MNVDFVYQVMLNITAKNKQDGYLSPNDFYIYINAAQEEYLDYLIGEYQQYKASRPIPVVSFGQTEKVRNSLAPLIYGTVLTPDSTTGISPYPGDYEYTDTMWSVYGHYRIRFVQQDSLFSFYHSEIDPVAQNPVYLINHEGFQFYPENIGMARLSYIRKPPSIVWAWVDDSNGIPVYDPANSQDPVWSNSDMFNIISRALRMTGVQFNSQQVSEFANDIKYNGQ